jgi:hypothetical protein
MCESALRETTRATWTELTTDLPSPPPPASDVTVAEMFVFLARTLQMVHRMRDKLTVYWATPNQFHTRFYSSAMKRDRYLHILSFLHFTDNNNEPDLTDENTDRLWKTRKMFEILNKTFSKFYSPSECLAVDEVIVLLKGRVIFRECIPKKHEHFGIKIYKSCDETGYTYDMIFPLRGLRKFHTEIIDISSGMIYWKRKRKSADTNSTQQSSVCLVQRW